MASRRTRPRTIHLLSSFFAWGTLFLLFSLLPFAANAQVQTRIRIIEASNVGQRVDASLRDIHTELGSLFNFTSYRLLKDVKFTLVANRPEKIPAHTGRYVEVTLVREHRKMVELQIRIFREQTVILDTLVRLAPGRTVLVGGPKHGKGVAILAVSARF